MRRVVHCWLVLLLSVCGHLAALDGIAPAIALPVDDPLLAPAGSVAATVAADPPAHLDLSALASWIFAWDEGSWQDLQSLGAEQSAGIVVVATNGYGTWEMGDGSNWITIGSGDTIALRDAGGLPQYLRFVPDPAAGDETATLDFRAWDGSAADGTWETGGSPGPYSAETRTLSVAVVYANDAPEVFDDVTTVVFFEHAQETLYDGVRPTITTVYDLISGAGSDPDYNALGIALTAIDLADGTWEWAQGDGAFAALSAPAIGEAFLLVYDDRLRFTPSGTTGNGTFGGLTVRLWDGTVGGSGGTETVVDLDAGASLSVDSLSVELTIDPFANNAPTIDALEGTPEVVAGGSVVFTVSATDAEGDTIVWSVYDDGESTYDPILGTATVSDNGDGTADITYTNISPGSTDLFTLAVEDAFGAVSTLEVTVNIVAPSVNTPPEAIVAGFPAVAVAGRPWEWLVTVRDDDADTPLTLSVVEAGEATLPAGFSAPVALATTRVFLDPQSETTVSERTFRLRGTPAAAGSIVLRLTPDDGTDTNPVDVTLVVADPAPVVVALPAVPLSTPADVRYAAIAPGSDTGFASLLSALAPHPADVARGWWWRSSTAGFLDMESTAVPIADQPAAAIFLASTVALSYSFDAKPYPMPFAITLPPATGASPAGWLFFGVPPLFDGSASTTSHDWSDFALQDANGQVVDDDAVIQTVLGATADPPWAYDPAQPVDDRYQPASTLESGYGYWLRNRSAQTYRLVRVAGGDGSYRIVNAVGGVSARSVAARSAAERPPLPPAGGAAGGGASGVAPAAGGGSACGAGGLAGLLLLGGLLLRLRRRS